VITSSNLDLSTPALTWKRFISRTTQETTYVLINVDNILITISLTQGTAFLLHSLRTDFAIKDLVPLHFFLGMEATTMPDGLILLQQHYIFDLLQKSNTSEAKPVKTPMSTTHTLSLLSGDPLTDPSSWLSLVGTLQYLSLTCPNISFVVYKVSQFMHQPTSFHLQAVKHFMRYLKATISYGLLLLRSSSHILQAYSDTYCAGYPKDRKSTDGFGLFLGPNLISWSSCKQQTIAHSSIESEYRTLSTTAAKLNWLQSMLLDHGIYLPTPSTLWYDNIGATLPLLQFRLPCSYKHIEIDFHFVRDKVASKTLVVHFIPSKNNLVGIFTKPIASPHFSLSCPPSSMSPALCLACRGVMKHQPHQRKSHGSTRQPNKHTMINIISRRKTNQHNT
jgi:hypothetical protein